MYSEIVAEFRRELPFYLRCTEVTAEKSAYQAARYLRHQAEPFPACLTRERIIKFLSYLASGPPDGRQKARREASSVNDILKGIRRFARWSVARGYIDRDPTEGIKGLAERTRVIVAPEPVDVRKLLAAACLYGETGELRARNVAMLAMLIDTGVRAAELTGLDCGDIWKGRRFTRVLTVRGKGGKERLVAFTPLARSFMRPYLKLRRPLPKESGLFVDWRGRRMTYPGLTHVVQRIGIKAGVKINLHDFRRYTHTELYKAGMSLVDGMNISGHATVKDYRLYIRGAEQEYAVIEHRKRSPLATVV